MEVRGAEERGAAETEVRGAEVRGLLILGAGAEERRGEEIPDVPTDALGMALPTRLVTRGDVEGGAVYIRCELVPELRVSPERPELDDEETGGVLRLPTRGPDPERDAGAFIEETSLLPPEEEVPFEREMRSEPEERVRDGARGDAADPIEVVAEGEVDCATTGEVAAGGALRITRPERVGLLLPIVVVPFLGPGTPPVWLLYQ
jgi:hypothetical protein